MQSNSPEQRDYFSDRSVFLDPHEYFRSAYSHGPVYEVPGKDYLLVTGFEECVDILRNTEDYSSIFCFSPYGAGAPLPFTPEGDDISDQLESYRTPEDLLVSYDGVFHTDNRSILNTLFTPSRLKANEAYMTGLANQLVGEVVAQGGCELLNDYALAFSTSVIADLEGVPEKDRQLFIDAISASPTIGSETAEDTQAQVPHIAYMYEFFERYIKDRRANPKEDVLCELANARYPDGSIPDLNEIVKLAVVLFLGGRESAAKYMASCMYFVARYPELQHRLREDTSLIPAFIEEVLRLEGSTKATFRVARKKTRIGDREIPAGTKLVVAMSAANRDPRRWENPDQFNIDRPRLREHLAFGKGPHICAGAPLARTEARVTVETFLSQTSMISLDAEKHGRGDIADMPFDYSYISRSLSALHLKLQA